MICVRSVAMMLRGSRLLFARSWRAPVAPAQLQCLKGVLGQRWYAAGEKGEDKGAAADATQEGKPAEGAEAVEEAAAPTIEEQLKELEETQARLKGEWVNGCCRCLGSHGHEWGPSSFFFSFWEGRAIFFSSCIFADQLLRQVAETENVRKLGVERMEEAKKFAVQQLIKDLIHVFDTLELAMSEVKG